MLKAIGLKNFQSHSKTLLKFSKGLNVIIGGSDSGKTSIVRALSLIAFNKPTGDSFIKLGSKEAEVRVMLDDDSIVIRKKGNRGNKFIVGGKEYGAVGKTVPEDIQKLLNLDDINFKFQLSSPFLLSESNGEIARALNKYANLSIIDKTVKNINAVKRRNKQQIELECAKIHDAKEELKQFDNIMNLTNDMESLEELHISLVSTTNTLRELKGLIAEVESEKDYSGIAESLQKMKERLEKVSKAIIIVDKDSDTVETISECIEDVQEANKVSIYEEVLIKNKKRLAGVSSLCEDVVFLEAKVNNIESIIDTDKKREEFINEKTEELEEMKITFQEMFPDVCPLCGAES